jgi:hypothetical protein
MKSLFKRALSAHAVTMRPRTNRSDKRLARQLDKADYAALTSRVISGAARALVDEVCARVVAWEQKSSARTYKRTTRAHKFRDAVGAFTADLVRARGNSWAEGWVFRSLHAKSFTAQRVSHRNFVALVAALRGLSLIEHKPGFRSKVDFGTGPVVDRAKASRFRARRAFIELAKRHGVNPAHAIDHFTEELPERPVHLRSASTRSFFTGAKTRGRSMRFDYTPKVHAIEADVKELNAFLRKFEISGALHQYYVRIFNEGDDHRFDWNLGGRLYSNGQTSYQQMERDQRLAMTINGEAVCEIDISSSYLTIFLGWHKVHIKNTQAIDETKDLYSEGDLNQEDRDAVKQWFVATFGSGKLVTKWSNDGVKEFRKHTGKNLRKFSAERIQRAALKAYPQLERWPSDERTWADLMWLESEAVIGTMLKLMRDYGVPTLAVHDSLLVPLSQYRLAEWRLYASYEQATGVPPILRPHVLHHGLHPVSLTPA